MKTWPNKSQQEIAEQVGCNVSTVCRAKDNLPTQFIPPTRTDSMGRTRPTSYATRKPSILARVRGVHRVQVLDAVRPRGCRGLPRPERFEVGVSIHASPATAACRSNSSPPSMASNPYRACWSSSWILPSVRTVSASCRVLLVSAVLLVFAFIVLPHKKAGPKAGESGAHKAPRPQTIRRNLVSCSCAFVPTFTSGIL